VRLVEIGGRRWQTPWLQLVIRTVKVCVSLAFENIFQGLADWWNLDVQYAMGEEFVCWDDAQSCRERYPLLCVPSFPASPIVDLASQHQILPHVVCWPKLHRSAIPLSGRESKYLLKVRYHHVGLMGIVVEKDCRVVGLSSLRKMLQRVGFDRNEGFSELVWPITFCGWLITICSFAFFQGTVNYCRTSTGLRC